MCTTPKNQVAAATPVTLTCQFRHLTLTCLQNEPVLPIMPAPTNQSTVNASNSDLINYINDKIRVRARIVIIISFIQKNCRTSPSLTHCGLTRALPHSRDISHPSSSMSMLAAHWHARYLVRPLSISVAALSSLVAADDALILAHLSERQNVYLPSMTLLDLSLEYKRDDLVFRNDLLSIQITMTQSYAGAIPLVHHVPATGTRSSQRARGPQGQISNLKSFHHCLILIAAAATARQSRAVPRTGC